MGGSGRGACCLHLVATDYETDDKYLRREIDSWNATGVNSMVSIVLTGQSSIRFAMALGVCDDISQIVIANCKMLLQIESKLISNFHKLQSEIIWAVQVHLYPLQGKVYMFSQSIICTLFGKGVLCPKNPWFCTPFPKKCTFSGKMDFLGQPPDLFPREEWQQTG